MPPSQRTPRYQRCAKSYPDTKIDLQFVNVKPDDPDQGRQTRAVIRANAAHFHWRHNRPPKDKAKTKQTRHGDVTRHDKRIPSPLSPMSSSTQLAADIDPFSSYNCNLPRALVNHCIAFSKPLAFLFIIPQLITISKMPNSFFPQYSLMEPTVSTLEQA
jgi:hypothetical protein